MDDQDLESLFSREEFKIWLYVEVIMSHELSIGWPRLGACNQMENSLCASIYCDRAWEDTRLTNTKSEEWIQVGQHMKHKECTTWDHVILWYAHERMTSSGDRHQGWEGQVQDKHLEKIICLKLVVHLVTMDMWRHALMKLSHSGVWGSKMWVFTKQQWSSEAFRLEWSLKRCHQDQAGCARQRYGLARFSFYRSQGVCWETGL